MSLGGVTTQNDWSSRLQFSAVTTILNRTQRLSDIKRYTISPIEKRALPILQLMNPRQWIASACLTFFLLAKASQVRLFNIIVILSQKTSNFFQFFAFSVRRYICFG